MHLNLKKPTLTPVGPPTIPPNPELCSILDPPSHNWDLMIQNWPARYFLCIYSISVLAELNWRLNSTWYWSPGINLSFHLLCPHDSSVLHNFPFRVRLLCPTVALITRFWALRSRAIHATLFLRTGKFFRILSRIVLACLFSSTKNRRVLKYHKWITTSTTTSGPTVNHYLWWDRLIRPGSVPLNIDPISNDTGRTESPTASAMIRSILISSYWKIINSACVSPVPFFWQRLFLQILVWPLCDNFLFATQYGLSVAGGLESVLKWPGFVLEVLGLRLSLVSEICSPCVLRYSPRAVSLDAQVINASDQF